MDGESDPTAFYTLNQRYRCFNMIIGSGQSGTVHPGLDMHTGEQIAIKVLDRAHIEADPARREALRREITVTMRLQHENIIKLKDVVVDETHIHLILELAQGGEMFQQVQARGALSEEEARIYFSQLISCVDYCHSASVCHRDLKLENVLLAAQGSQVIKVTDFGFSKDFLNESLPKTKRVGTLAYMAPEVALDSGDCTYDGKAADIWACGVILYTLVAAQYPFGDEIKEKPATVYQRIVTGTFTLPPGLSESLNDLLRKILVPDPEERATVEMVKSHHWFTGHVFGSHSAVPDIPEFQWPAGFSMDEHGSAMSTEHGGPGGGMFAGSSGMCGPGAEMSAAHEDHGMGGDFAAAAEIDHGFYDDCTAMDDQFV